MVSRLSDKNTSFSYRDAHLAIYVFLFNGLQNDKRRTFIWILNENILEQLCFDSQSHGIELPTSFRSNWHNTTQSFLHFHIAGNWNIAKGTTGQKVARFHKKTASESRPNFSFKILTKHLAQNVDQSLTAKSRPNFTFKNFRLGAF